MSEQALSVRSAVADVLVALADRVRRTQEPPTTLALTTPDADSAEGATVRTLCSLPAGSLVLHSIEICKFLESTGKEAFIVRTSGTSSRSDFVGTVEAGKLIGLDLWPRS